MANFGEAFARNFTSGYQLGNAMHDQWAASQYEKDIENAEEQRYSSIDTAPIEEAAGLTTEQRPGAYVDDYEGTPEDAKTALEASRKFQESKDYANRDYEVARKTALAKFYTRTGNVAEAEKTREQMDRAAWTRDFWAKLRGNSSAYDGDIVTEYNNSFDAQLAGVKLVHDPKAQTVTLTRNGQAQGQPIQITDQMRSPYIQALYTRQFGRRFNSEPTQQDFEGWGKQQSALSSAITGTLDREEKVRSNKATEQLKKEANVIAAKDSETRRMVAENQKAYQEGLLADKQDRTKIAQQEADSHDQYRKDLIDSERLRLEISKESNADKRTHLEGQRRILQQRADTYERSVSGLADHRKAKMDLEQAKLDLKAATTESERVFRARRVTALERRVAATEKLVDAKVLYLDKTAEIKELGLKLDNDRFGFEKELKTSQQNLDRTKLDYQKANDAVKNHVSMEKLRILEKDAQRKLEAAQLRVKANPEVPGLKEELAKAQFEHKKVQDSIKNYVDLTKLEDNRALALKKMQQAQKEIDSKVSLNKSREAEIGARIHKLNAETASIYHKMNNRKIKFDEADMDGIQWARDGATGERLGYGTYRNEAGQKIYVRNRRDIEKVKTMAQAAQEASNLGIPASVVASDTEHRNLIVIDKTDASGNLIDREPAGIGLVPYYQIGTEAGLEAVIEAKKKAETEAKKNPPKTALKV